MHVAMQPTVAKRESEAETELELGRETGAKAEAEAETETETDVHYLPLAHHVEGAPLTIDERADEIGAAQAKERYNRRIRTPD